MCTLLTHSTRTPHTLLTPHTWRLCLLVLTRISHGCCNVYVSRTRTHTHTHTSHTCTTKQHQQHNNTLRHVVDVGFDADPNDLLSEYTTPSFLVMFLM
eukprot:NODE_4149_length_492_cov_237.097065_g3548_i0.p1 GENE.NODE_4149_length_492_cov_237.097065_g3548_i0~~NODE_4149_length_492_cov_237.097065_g3548_i0.p1  ORF type:complete len:98 (-),score=25.94 NODE_4149_length_492_cov_237.097065_g3548_i0:59-352(-)